VLNINHMHDEEIRQLMKINHLLGSTSAREKKDRWKLGQGHFKIKKVRLEDYDNDCFPALRMLADAAASPLPLEQPRSRENDLKESKELVSPSSDLSMENEDQDGLVKARRKRASAHQLECLRLVFQKTPFPSTEERKKIAKDLNMTPRSVQIWFQNQRQHARNLLHS